MLKGIIFDMDGVLINSEPFHYQVWKEVLKERGIHIEYEVYKPCIGSTIGCLMGILHDHYGINKQDTQLIARMKEWKQKMIDEQGYPPLLPYVKEMLQRFQKAGYQMAIASSSPQRYIEEVTKYWGIQSYFQTMISGEKVENPKPAPDVFLKTAEAMGLLPKECLVIEDSENGCKAAKAAGMTCMGYDNPDSGEQNLQNAAMIVEGFDEIDGAFVYKIHCHHHHIPAIICETERLIIKEMEKRDISRLMEICAQKTSIDACEGVEKTLEEEIEEFENYRTYMYELCDMGYWCVIEKNTGKIIGKAGIEPKYWDEKRTVIEMGYIIDENYRGQGYAYEACKAILCEAENKGVSELYCRIKKNNKPSRMLARKLGFVKTEEHMLHNSKDMEIWRYTFN